MKITIKVMTSHIGLKNKTNIKHDLHGKGLKVTYIMDKKYKDID